MSPASYLTAPPRDATSIVALSSGAVRACTVAGMAFWGALALFFAALLVGLAYVVVRGLALWRLAKRTGNTFTSELDRISLVSGQIDSELAKASASAERLQNANGRLSVSRARLDVQLAAIREARAQVRRTFWFVPGR